MLQAVTECFRSLYQQEPSVFIAPGRVNLIGEHTDYNEGLVLPGAVDKRIYVAIAKNHDSRVNVFARALGEQVSFSITDRQPRSGWINYVLGVYAILREAWPAIDGVDLVIDGDIPIGAGMSSSAALCSGVGFALHTLFSTSHSLLQLAQVAQRAEHEFAGVRCGLMDQFACLHGKKGHVILLDCRTLSYGYIPFAFPDHAIVLVHTGVTHSLAASAYNTRRAQCEEGVSIAQTFLPSVQSLRDIRKADLFAHRAAFDADVFEKCLYVIEENERVLAACELLRRNDLVGFGKKMYASHQGLRIQYSVSCDELDFLVELAAQVRGVAGARMMGGGFGGCTINIVRKSAVSLFQDSIGSQFAKQFGRMPPFYIMELDEGVRQLC